MNAKQRWKTASCAALAETAEFDPTALRPAPLAFRFTLFGVRFEVAIDHPYIAAIAAIIKGLQVPQ
jgi:hypothetical protein